MLDTVAVFFSNNPFIKTATYTPYGGSSKSVQIIFDAPYSLSSVDGITYTNANPSAVCKTSDVATVNDQATIVIDTTTYYVVDAQPDGTGITRLILSTEYFFSSFAHLKFKFILEVKCARNESALFFKASIATWETILKSKFYF